jgi:hypothetical protein
VQIFRGLGKEAMYNARRLSPGGGWCGAAFVGLLLAMLALLAWWLASSSQAAGAWFRSMWKGSEEGEPGACEEVFGSARKVAVARPSNLSLDGFATPTAPLEVGRPELASVGGVNLRDGGSAGTQLDGAFEFTEAGKDYLNVYAPAGLASVMPAGWKTNAKGGGDQAGGAFAEFSRYSISPEAVARSENLRASLRLSENTRQQMSRTLGSDSLLRNAVTPIGPYPIGDKAMLWNDSSVRQGYIAAATGFFPTLGE